MDQPAQCRPKHCTKVYLDGKRGAFFIAINSVLLSFVRFIVLTSCYKAGSPTRVFRSWTRATSPSQLIITNSTASGTSPDAGQRVSESRLEPSPVQHYPSFRSTKIDLFLSIDIKFFLNCCVYWYNCLNGTLWSYVSVNFTLKMPKLSDLLFQRTYLTLLIIRLRNCMQEFLIKYANKYP